MLADGATVAGLGRRCAHSEREMSRLLTGTYRRLGARDRTDAMLLADRFGLLDEDHRPGTTAPPAFSGQTARELPASFGWRL